MIQTITTIIGTIACIELAVFIWELIEQNRLLEKQSHLLVSILKTFMDIEVEDNERL